jgi:hypothetical protein
MERTKLNEISYAEATSSGATEAFQPNSQTRDNEYGMEIHRSGLDNAVMQRYGAVIPRHSSPSKERTSR